MPYPGHRRVLVFLGLIVLRRGGVNVYVHAVAGLPCCSLVAVGVCVVAADRVSLGWLMNTRRTSVFKHVGGLLIPRG